MAIDIVGLFEKSKSGYRYLLTCLNICEKWNTQVVAERPR